MGKFWVFVWIVAALYLLLKLLRKFYFSGGKCPDKYIRDLDDKTILITGGSSGIGFALAKEYVKFKAKKVIICSKRSKKGEESAKRLRELAEETNSKEKTEIEFIQLDLSSLPSVESVAKQVEKENIDILVLNAACFTPGERKVSEHNIELMFSVTFLGHFHLVNSLYDNLVDRDVRVICTTGGQKMMPLRLPKIEDVFTKMENVSVMEVFGLAKTCQMLFMKNLDLKFRDEDSFSSAFYLHPGITSAGNMGMGSQKVPLHFKLLKTFVMNPISSIVGKTETEIVQTHLYLTFAPRSVLKSGGYFVDCKYEKEMDFFTEHKNISYVSELGNQIIKKIKEEQEDKED